MQHTFIRSNQTITRIIQTALIEDIGDGDVTTNAIFEDDINVTGKFISKDEGIIAGLDIAWLVFQSMDSEINFVPHFNDGDRVKRGDIIGTVSGKAKKVLPAERTALNFLQRMSGIASLTKKFVEAIEGTRAKITDTRKTAPGLRILDKLAVEIGGGVNHRFGLYDMILIKDNHISAVGSIEKAISRCREYIRKRNLSIKIEIEARDINDVEEILRIGGVDRIMLDNFKVEDIYQAVKMIGGRFEVEASGGITLDNVREIAETGVDYISIGLLTHSPKAFDISLEIT
jgi:nicotinate-nucleotide pyrophosphorylase (carboxylating)